MPEFRPTVQTGPPVQHGEPERSEPDWAPSPIKPPNSSQINFIRGIRPGAGLVFEPATRDQWPWHLAYQSRGFSAAPGR